MGIEHYLFAFYVFVLICAIILLCRALFSRFKKKKQLFDEKEAKLLKLYQTVEDAMDEFYDMTAESKAEIDEALKSLSSLKGMAYMGSEGQKNPYEIDKATVENEGPSKVKKDAESFSSNNTKPEIIAEAFQNMLKTTDIPASSRNESIIKLFDSGKTKTHIARELNITHNEVDLVIEMNKKSL